MFSSVGTDRYTRSMIKMETAMEKTPLTPTWLVIRLSTPMTSLQSCQIFFKYIIQKPVSEFYSHDLIVTRKNTGWFCPRQLKRE